MANRKSNKKAEKLLVEHLNAIHDRMVTHKLDRYDHVCDDHRDSITGIGEKIAPDHSWDGLVTLACNASSQSKNEGRSISIISASWNGLRPANGATWWS